jgi:hypothetical protein
VGVASVALSKKSPLYFQHEGHSRIIIGVQKIFSEVETVRRCPRRKI